MLLAVGSCAATGAMVEKCRVQTFVDTYTEKLKSDLYVTELHTACPPMLLRLVPGQHAPRLTNREQTLPVPTFTQAPVPSSAR